MSRSTQRRLLRSSSQPDSGQSRRAQERWTAIECCRWRRRRALDGDPIGSPSICIRVNLRPAVISAKLLYLNSNYRHRKSARLICLSPVRPARTGARPYGRLINLLHPIRSSVIVRTHPASQRPGDGGVFSSTNKSLRQSIRLAQDSPGPCCRCSSRQVKELHTGARVNNIRALCLSSCVWLYHCCRRCCCCCNKRLLEIINILYLSRNTHTLLQ